MAAPRLDRRPYRNGLNSVRPSPNAPVSLAKRRSKRSKVRCAKIESARKSSRLSPTGRFSRRKDPEVVDFRVASACAKIDLQSAHENRDYRSFDCTKIKPC